jgi:cytochrome c553
MQGVAHTPEDGSMQVIAAWLSSLPPEKAYKPMGRPT